VYDNAWLHDLRRSDARRPRTPSGSCARSRTLRTSR